MSLWDKMDRLGHGLGGVVWDALRAAALYRRDTLYLCLGGACNLRCLYCYASLGATGRGLSLRARVEAVRQAREAGLRGLTIVGEGEPLLDPELFDLLGEASAMGLRLKIFTNAILVSREVARRLADLGVVVVAKVISLRPEVVRAVGRGESDLREGRVEGMGVVALPRGLWRLLEVCERRDLVLETVVLRPTVEDIVRIGELSLALGVGFFPETLVVAGPRAAELAALRPGEGEMEALYGRLSALLGGAFEREQRWGACFIAPNPVVGAEGVVRTCLVGGRPMGDLRVEALGGIMARPGWPSCRLTPRGPGGWRSCPARSIRAALTAGEGQ